jgi:hypothetical protein
VARRFILSWNKFLDDDEVVEGAISVTRAIDLPDGWCVCDVMCVSMVRRITD